MGRGGEKKSRHDFAGSGLASWRHIILAATSQHCCLQQHRALGWLVSPYSGVGPHPPSSRPIPSQSHSRLQPAIPGLSWLSVPGPASYLLRGAVLCYAMPCCAMPCCVCSAVPRDVQRSAVLCDALRCYAMWCGAERLRERCFPIPSLCSSTRSHFWHSLWLGIGRRPVLGGGAWQE